MRLLYDLTKMRPIVMQVTGDHKGDVVYAVHTFLKLSHKHESQLGVLFQKQSVMKCDSSYDYQ